MPLSTMSIFCPMIAYQGMLPSKHLFFRSRDFLPPDFLSPPPWFPVINRGGKKSLFDIKLRLFTPRNSKYACGCLFVQVLFENG